MKRQNGIMLLEVAIFLVLLSLGYLSWMSVRKNVEQYDFSMQVARSLCYQQDMLSVYIEKNKEKNKDSPQITTGNEDLTAIPFNSLSDVITLIDNKTPLKYSYYMVNNSNSSQSNIYSKDKLQKYIQTSKVKAIVVLSVKNGKVPEYLRKYLAASLGIFGAIPVRDNNIISLRNDFFDVSVLERQMQKIGLDDVIAVALIPEIPSPYQTCFYGAQYNE